MCSPLIVRNLCDHLQDGHSKCLPSENHVSFYDSQRIGNVRCRCSLSDPFVSQESWMGTCSARLSAWMQCSTGASSMMSTTCMATLWRLPQQSKDTVAMDINHGTFLILLDMRCLWFTFKNFAR